MDEASLEHMLNAIRKKIPDFHWKTSSKYDNGKGVMLMEISFFDPTTNGNHGKLVYKSKTGELLNGWYKGLKTVERDLLVTDAILDIMNYEENELEGQ